MEKNQNQFIIKPKARIFDKTLYHEKYRLRTISRYRPIFKL